MKVAAVCLLSALLASPAAFAHTSSGGHFSGGHFSSGHLGGSHFSGGGHYGGGGHFAPASPHFSTQHFSAPQFSAPHYASAPHVAAATSPHYRPLPAGPRAVNPGWRGHPGVGGYAHAAHWGGGYWGGRYWPGVFYGPRFIWFLPTIPLYCATFWWNSVPYYYYNDVYYTWSPAADGYVATDPPPVASEAPAEAPPSEDAPIDAAMPDASAAYAPAYAAPSSPSDHVFAYPTGGQSGEQQSADRAQCEQWAAAQAGGAGGADHRRALIACFQGRGYSAQ